MNPIAEARGLRLLSASMVDYLKAKLDLALARIPALPPPAGTDGPKLTRWQALKIAILGR